VGVGGKKKDKRGEKGGEELTLTPQGQQPITLQHQARTGNKEKMKRSWFRVMPGWLIRAPPKVKGFKTKKGNKKKKKGK